MGKDPSKGAIGHSRYVGWLDTSIDIVKNKNILPNKTLEISGKDAEKMEIGLDFNYPIHKVTEIEAQVRRKKVNAAGEFFISQLAAREMQEQELRRLARAAGHSDYAIWTALKELRTAGKIEDAKAGGQGNRKILKLSSTISTS